MQVEIDNIKWITSCIGAFGENKKDNIMYDIIWDKKINNWKGTRLKDGIITHTLYGDVFVCDLIIDLMKIDNPDTHYYVEQKSYFKGPTTIETGKYSYSAVNKRINNGKIKNALDCK